MLWVTVFLAWFFQARPLGTQEGCNYGQSSRGFPKSDFAWITACVLSGNSVWRGCYTVRTSFSDLVVALEYLQKCRKSLLRATKFSRVT